MMCRDGTSLQSQSITFLTFTWDIHMILGNAVLCQANILLSKQLILFEKLII